MEKVVCVKQDNHWRIRELGKWLPVRECEAGSLEFDPTHCCYKQAPQPHPTPQKKLGLMTDPHQPSGLGDTSLSTSLMVFLLAEEEGLP